MPLTSVTPFKENIEELYLNSYLRLVFFLLDKKDKKQLPTILLYIITTSLLDIVGIGLVGGFLILIANHAQFLTYGKIVHITDRNTLIFLAGFLIIFTLVSRAIVISLLQRKITLFSINCTLKIKIRLMEAYQHAPYSFHLQHNSAYLMNRMNQVDGISTNILMASLTSLASTIIGFSIVGLLGIKYPAPTLILIFLFGAVFYINNKVLKQLTINNGKVLSVISGQIIKNINNGLHGLQEIRILGREAFFINQVASVAGQCAEINGLLSVLLLLPRYIIELVLAVFIIATCLLATAIAMTSGEIVAFLGVFASAGLRLLPIVSQLVSGINQIRIHNQIVIPICHDLKVLRSDHKMFDASADKTLFLNCSLTQVFFKYPHAVQETLKNINLHFIKGQSIAIIGPSGAGKSTLVNVILGLLEPSQGQILVNNQPISNMRAWLDHIAYIPQMIFLLDDTVKNNVAFGVEPAEINDARLHHAIKMAQLDQVVDQLPEGVDTMLGENGIRLSGGQRQRIALARAFYHDRDIIVMDEATSALDYETEREIISSIQRLQGIKTLIIITHRLTTVKHCDVIVKIEKGQISKIGSFKEIVSADLV